MVGQGKVIREEWKGYKVIDGEGIGGGGNRRKLDWEATDEGKRWCGATSLVYL